MSRYICIHGHFYQPPRENPWLESIELQDSAKPFHDWNARITAECYGPNATSRIFEPSGRIAGIMNNYSRISFNMGPTLLAWMEDAEPVIYEAILEGDRIGQEFYSGHGPAIAQVYNHLIMPLANRRDKETQIVWGIRDFQHRFGRDPEGMWLAETAVDYETLELLVEHGITFTILAPRQAKEIKRLDAEEWHDVSEGRIDPRRPYLCRLPSGRQIALFFYDGPIAQDLAFGGLLHNGEAMADRLLQSFDHEVEETQLVTVAADGETFGHHHKQGEMALSYCIYHTEFQQSARFTIYGEYLEMHPPTWEVRVYDNSSWSCIHGVERWRSDCGCNSGRQGWNQKWRAPLREALDWLRDRMIPIYEKEAAKLFEDPWGARNRYISPLLEKNTPATEAFLESECGGKVGAPTMQRALMLLESQRHAMLMYTSCGWFFDEISGIETTQILRYAARAIQLTNQLVGEDLEEGFLKILERAPSNIPHNEHGRGVYERFVKPVRIDLERVAMHFAASSLFRDYTEEMSIYCYDVQAPHYERHFAGKMRLALGRVKIRSQMTHEESEYSFAVTHLGDHNMSGGIREYMGETEFNEMCQKTRHAFDRNDVPEVIRLTNKHFEGKNFTLWHLFLDEQREIMSRISDEAEHNIESFHRDVYRDHYPLMNAMSNMGMPLPRVLQTTVDFVLNLDLRAVLSEPPVDPERFRSTVDEVRKWGVEVEGETLGFMGSEQLAWLADRLAENPLDFNIIDEMKDLLHKYQELNVPLNLWYSQNLVYEIGLEQYAIRSYLAEKGDPVSTQWTEQFRTLANDLGVHVE